MELQNPKCNLKWSDCNRVQENKYYESVKKEWDILKTTQEKTITVEISKIQKLTKYFESLTMDDDESDDF